MTLGSDRQALDGQVAHARGKATVVDRGLQHERTDLAWSRTAAAILVAGVLHIRLAALADGRMLFLAGLTFMLFGAVLLRKSTRRYLALREILASGEPPGDGPVWSTAVVVVVFGLASWGLIAIGGWSAR